MPRADLDKQPTEVAAMFDEVAERYDLTNDVLALGQPTAGRPFERGTLHQPGVKPGDRVLFGKWSGSEVKLVRNPSEWRKWQVARAKTSAS